MVLIAKGKQITTNSQRCGSISLRVDPISFFKKENSLVYFFSLLKNNLTNRLFFLHSQYKNINLDVIRKIVIPLSSFWNTLSNTNFDSIFIINIL